MRPRDLLHRNLTHSEWNRVVFSLNNGSTTNEQQNKINLLQQVYWLMGFRVPVCRPNPAELLLHHRRSIFLLLLVVRVKLFLFLNLNEIYLYVCVHFKFLF